MLLAGTLIRILIGALPAAEYLAGVKFRSRYWKESRGRCERSGSISQNYRSILPLSEVKIPYFRVNYFHLHRGFIHLGAV